MWLQEANAAGAIWAKSHELGLLKHSGKLKCLKVEVEGFLGPGGLIVLPQAVSGNSTACLRWQCLGLSN